MNTDKRIEEIVAEFTQDLTIYEDAGATQRFLDRKEYLRTALTSFAAEVRREEREKVFSFQRRMYKSQIPMDLRHQEMFEEAVNTRDVCKAVWIWQNTITDAYNRALSDVAEALTQSDPTV